ncbi:hypothetical protein JZ751_011329 [Albula glossodonta]|uniref:Uncharacterized protein n=1 Tax=Albula glossodonta TaxID=121402 RepID=A0A8T2MMA3_9TELE|nr:hypothetical protein JZ751_011329 [Albula glossodonta]
MEEGEIERTGWSREMLQNKKEKGVEDAGREVEEEEGRNVWIYSIYPANYNETQTDIPYCNKTLYLFAFWITTLGNVWIYSIYPANYNETQTGIPYCNKTLYLFAFWITTLGYAFLLLFIFCGFIGCCCMGCLGKVIGSDDV